MDSSSPDARVYRRRRKRPRRSIANLVLVGILVAATIGIGLLAAKFIGRSRNLEPGGAARLPDYVGDVQQFRQEYLRHYGVPLQNADLETRFLSARKYVGEKNYLGAATVLERLSTSAALPLVFTDLGLMYARLSETAKAIDAFREVVVRDAAYEPMRKSVKSLNLPGVEPAHHEVEPNDSTFTATLIGVMTPLEGELRTASDVDYFRFVTPPAPRDTLSIAVTSKNSSVTLDLYDSAGRLLEGKSSGGGTASLPRQVRLPCNAVYYLRIANRGADSTKYLIEVTALKTFDAFEPNDTLDTPRSIPIGQAIEANVMDSTDNDFYQFVPPNAGLVTVTVAARDDGFVPAFSVLSASRTTIAFSIRPDRNQKVADYSFPATAKDPFYLQIWGLEETTGKYTLTIQQQQK